jgi:hypothetical protein
MMLLFFVILIIFIFFIIIKTDYVYDLSHNRKCNYFEIYDINKLLSYISVSSNKIMIDEYLPEWIEIKTFPKKGWGLVSKKSFKKGEVIYEVPVLIYPEEGVEIISKKYGNKILDKNDHFGDLEQKYNLFSYYDCLLNHDDEPNAYHDTSILIKDKKVYFILKAFRDIAIGDELTINYLYLDEYVYYIASFVDYISNILNKKL